MWPSSGIHSKVWWYCFTGLVWVCHDGEISASVMCAILGCAAQVCLLAVVLCGSPVTVCPYPMSTVGGLLLWVVWRVCDIYNIYN